MNESQKRSTPEHYKAYVSIIGADSHPVVKRFFWTGTKLESDHSAYIASGYAQTIEASDPQTLLRIIENLSPNEALALGVLPEYERRYTLVTNEKRTVTSIARTKEFFQFPRGLGWMLLDLDAKDLPDEIIDRVAGRHLFDVILEAVPELQSVGYILRASSSAGVILPDGTHNPATGFHVWVLVQEANHIPDILKTISDILWSRGLGFIKVSKAGNLLERTLIDLAVGSPERLVFESDPIVEKPLNRNAPEPRVNIGGPLTSVQGPDVDIEALKTEAKKSVSGYAKSQRETFEETQIERIRKRGKLTVTVAKQLFKQRQYRGLLHDDDSLEIGKGEFQKVGEFLNTTKGKRGLPCPVEGSEYGLTTAQFYREDANNAETRLISFAHGVVTEFYFERYKHLRGLKWLPADKSFEFDPTKTADQVGLALKDQIKLDVESRLLPYVHNRRGNPPQLLYQVSVGVGKTQQATTAVIGMAAAGLRVLVRVPRIDLAEEWLQNLSGTLRTGVGIWRGREQPDPDHADQQMCLRNDVITEAALHGIKPSSVCGNKKQGYCKFHPDNPEVLTPCAYLLQNLSMHQVVICAGDKTLTMAPRPGLKRSEGWRALKPKQNDLFWRPIVNVEMISQPSENRPDFDCLIVDETDPFGLISELKDSLRVKFDHAIQIPDETDEKGGESIQDWNLIEDFREYLQSRFDPHFVSQKSTSEVAEATLQLLEESGALMTPPQTDDKRYLQSLLFADPGDGEASDRVRNNIEVCEYLAEIIQERIPRPIGESNAHHATLDEIRAANKEISVRRTQLQALYTLCHELATRARVDINHLKNIKFTDPDDPSQGVTVRTGGQLYSDFQSIPALIFDATATPELLKYTYHYLETSFCDAANDGSGVKRYQLRDSTLPYQTVKTDHWYMRLIALSQLLANTYPTAGMIAPKAVVEEIEGRVPRSVDLGHFGALSGINRFENVSALVVVSRQAVAPNVMEESTATLTREPVSGITVNDWYRDETDYILYKDGRRGWSVDRDTHPDPLVESARQALTSASLEQALGRGRNVRRDASRPLTEFILTSIPTQRPVDGTFTLNELKAATGWIGLMLHLGVWISQGKGAEVLFFILNPQRLDSLYNTLIETSAFESPEQASNWLKQQLSATHELAPDHTRGLRPTESQATQSLYFKIQSALDQGQSTIDILCMPYPIDDFKAVRAKKRGARYFAELFVRTKPTQLPQEALSAILGPRASDVEIEG